MPGVDWVLVHQNQKALVTIDVYAGLLAIYYGAEYAKFAHLLLDCV